MVKPLVDPIGLQYFIVRLPLDNSINTISEVIKNVKESLRITKSNVISKKDLVRIISEITGIHRSETPKPKNDLARLGLIVPAEQLSMATFLIKEKSFHEWGKAREWALTDWAYRLNELVDKYEKALIIAKSYISTPIMESWLSQLYSYGVRIEKSLAIKVLRDVLMNFMRYATRKEGILALQELIFKCDKKPKDILKKTLKVIEVLTKEDALKIESNYIVITNIDQYLRLKSKVSIHEYLYAIARAYKKYLEDKGLYEILLQQGDASWPVSLSELLKRIDNAKIRSLKLEDHIDYCKKLSYIYVEFEYSYQPFAKESSQHILSIKLSLLRKILGED